MLGSPLASMDVNANSRNSAQKAKVSKQYQKKSHLEHSKLKVVGEVSAAWWSGGGCVLHEGHREPPPG